MVRTMATCRITILPLNFQKLQAGYPTKKMLKKWDRSRYVYENKQNSDKMPGEKSDIYVAMTRFLQIIEPYDSHLPRKTYKALVEVDYHTYLKGGLAPFLRLGVGCKPASGMISP